MTAMAKNAPSPLDHQISTSCRKWAAAVKSIVMNQFTYCLCSREKLTD